MSPLPRLHRQLDRLAIVMLSAIGDAVHVLPVVTALKRQRPGSRITWFLAPGPASLVRGHPDVDEIVVFSASGGMREWMGLRERLRRRKFDVVLDFQVALKAGLLTAMIDAPVKLGFDRRRARDMNWLFTTERIAPRANQHVQDQYFEFLEHLGIPSQPVEWKLGPWDHEAGLMRDVLDSTDRPIVSVAISSARLGRNWPAERWAEVIDSIQERHGLRAVLVGGRSEPELAAERIIMERVRERPVSTLGCSLRELVALIRGSALVMTPDTAPLHIAVALGVPVVGLFGMTDPRRTGPYRASHDLIVDAFRDPSDGDRIIVEKRSGRMERITVEQVLAKVELWHRTRR
jgi:heptosyltransferase I